MDQQEKEARRAYYKSYREKRKAQLKEYRKKWEEKNPDKTKQYTQDFWRRKAENMKLKENEINLKSKTHKN